ncbi:MAG: hypothetical protein ACK521_00830 [bacterium]
MLPTDIGDKNVVLQVKSLLYDGTVMSVNLSFKVKVRCMVSSLTLTGPEDFTYTLHEGVVVKGPFTVEQVNQCQFTPTYTAEIHQNGVFVSAAGNYHTNDQSFHF